jgi:N-acetylneuraminic acid mutarotase
MQKILLVLLMLLTIISVYSQAPDRWAQKTDFGGTERAGAVGLSIGNKGYVGTGSNGLSYYKDFWEYDPATNAWTQKADFGGTARSGATGFSIGSKGYVGTGESPTLITMTFGNMILRPMYGLRKQSLEA